AWSDLLDQTQLQLQWWILARVTSMVITGLLVTVALWLLDFPLALAFGVLSGLLSFVPYVGPLLGLFAPVMFAAFSHDAPSPLVVASVYIVVELVESYLITPSTQRKGIPLPPALTLSAMALLGVLAGGLGVALAAPLAVAVMAVLDETWIKG